VDAAAARDEESGPRRIPVEEGETEEARGAGRREGHAPAPNTRGGQAAEPARCDLLPDLSHASYNPAPAARAPGSGQGI